MSVAFPIFAKKFKTQHDNLILNPTQTAACPKILLNPGIPSPASYVSSSFLYIATDLIKTCYDP
jgi:hypothetical protein